MKKIATILLSTGLITLSNAADAAFGKSFEYIGLTAQYHKYKDLDFAPDVVDKDFQNYDYSDEDSGNAMRFLYGRQLTPYFAIESGINFYSNPSFTITNTTISEFGEESVSTLLSGSFKSFGVDLKAVGTFAITNAHFVRAHAGAIFWDNEFSYVEGPITDPQSASDSKTGVDPIFGVGYGYSISRNMALFLDVESTVIQDVEIQSTSLSLVLKL